MTSRARFVVCEDGREYLERFQRFLGGEFEFQRVEDLEGAAAALPSATGLLLDLDFRRLAPHRLVDETGTAGPRDGLAAEQGILILRALRRRGQPAPAMLFADLDDPGRVAYLQGALAPLVVVPSSESLAATAARMRQWAGHRTP